MKKRVRLAIPEVFFCRMALVLKEPFGGEEGRDISAEIERLQRHEDLVEEDYDPFHHKRGEKIIFTKRRLIAKHHTNVVGGGIVFSPKPIPVGTMFQVKVLEKKDGRRGPLVSTCLE